MTNTRYLELQTFLREKIKTTDDYKKATSLALGVSIARLIPLPAANEENITYQYDTSLVHTVKAYINEFNENIVVDVDLVAQTARSFWLMRYLAAHPDLNVPAIPVGCNSFIEKLNHAVLYVAPETNEYLNKYSELMVVLVNRILSVLKDVNPNQI